MGNILTLLFRSQGIVILVDFDFVEDEENFSSLIVYKRVILVHLGGA